MERGILYIARYLTLDRKYIFRLPSSSYSNEKCLDHIDDYSRQIHPTLLKMKFAAILITLVASTSAAPALIWKNSRTGESMTHSSKEVSASTLFASTVKAAPTDEMSLGTVFFLVGRDEHGNEGLSHLTSSGALPSVSSKYEDAHSIYYNVDGVESSNTVSQHCKKGLQSKKTDKHVVETTLTQFNLKLKSLHESASLVEEAEILPTGQMIPKAKKAERRHKRALDAAKVLIVNVDAKEHSSLDSAVHAAIESEQVDSVVLSAIRSVGEVKRARSLTARERLSMMKTVPARNGKRMSRRLEDADDAAADDDAADEEEEGTYYVNMTPNILAGILYTVFFFLTAYTGITCMSLIEGQDVYVTKYPGIGREA